jgi:hypothetical protein
LLRLLGHELETALNGSEALERCTSFQPHVVLLDVGLPGLDGFAVTQEKVRELEFTLYPKVVELSITEAVKGLMRRLAKDHGYAIEYVCPPALTCGRKAAIGLYRMVEGFFARSSVGQSAAWRVTLGESAEGIALAIVQTSPPEVSDPAVVMDPLTREYIRAYRGRCRIAADPTRIDVVFPVA